MQEIKKSSSSKEGQQGKNETMPALEEHQASTAKDSVSSQPESYAKDPTFKNTLTFSGLLNAIDGVASQEGRVLIMTTVSEQGTWLQHRK